MGDCVDLWGTFWSSLRIYRKINRLFYQFRCCIIVERGLVDSKNCNLYFTGSGGFIWSWCPESRAQLITAIVRVLVKILFMRVWESPPVFFFWRHQTVYRLYRALILKKYKALLLRHEVFDISPGPLSQTQDIYQSCSTRALKKKRNTVTHWSQSLLVWGWRESAASTRKD